MLAARSRPGCLFAGTDPPPFPPLPQAQVLAPLSPADVLLVAGLPAVSEELLFRGALVPAIYPDW